MIVLHSLIISVPYIVAVLHLITCAFDIMMCVCVCVCKYVVKCVRLEDWMTSVSPMYENIKDILITF